MLVRTLAEKIIFLSVWCLPCTQACLCMTECLVPQRLEDGIESPWNLGFLWELSVFLTIEPSPWIQTRKFKYKLFFVCFFLINNSQRSISSESLGTTGLLLKGFVSEPALRWTWQKVMLRSRMKRALKTENDGTGTQTQRTWSSVKRKSEQTEWTQNASQPDDAVQRNDLEINCYLLSMKMA